MTELNRTWQGEAEAAGRPYHPVAHRHRHQFRQLLRRQPRLDDPLRLFGDRRRREPRLARRRAVEGLRADHRARRVDVRGRRRAGAGARPDPGQGPLAADPALHPARLPSMSRRRGLAGSSRATKRCWRPIAPGIGTPPKPRSPPAVPSGSRRSTNSMALYELRIAVWRQTPPPRIGTGSSPRPRNKPATPFTSLPRYGSVGPPQSARDACSTGRRTAVKSSGRESEWH